MARRVAYRSAPPDGTGWDGLGQPFPTNQLHGKSWEKPVRWPESGGFAPDSGPFLTCISVSLGVCAKKLGSDGKSGHSPKITICCDCLTNNRLFVAGWLWITLPDAVLGYGFEQDMPKVSLIFPLHGTISHGT